MENITKHKLKLIVVFILVILYTIYTAITSFIKWLPYGIFLLFVGYILYWKQFQTKIKSKRKQKAMR